jgi:hypothetical protein
MALAIRATKVATTNHFLEEIAYLRHQQLVVGRKELAIGQKCRGETGEGGRSNQHIHDNNLQLHGF